jgi:hypothetical protein
MWKLRKLLWKVNRQVDSYAPNYELQHNVQYEKQIRAEIFHGKGEMFDAPGIPGDVLNSGVQRLPTAVVTTN